MEHSFVSISTNKRTSAQLFILRVAPVAMAERGQELGLLRECTLLRKLLAVGNQDNYFHTEGSDPTLVVLKTT